MGLAGPPGQNLGTATGSVIVDTSQPEQAVGRMRRVGRDMESALGRIDSGAKQAESGLVRVSNTIGKLQGQIVGLGATGAILTGFGVNMAGNLEVAEIRLKGMTGSLSTARVLMDDLRKRAVAAGVPFSDMLALATRLLPSLHGNTEELERWVGLARRVATLNMQEGLAGAAFSINEALTSGGTDLVSLVERFNISRAQLRAELENNGGDFAAALDVVLTRMGITAQVADEMGQSFQASMRVGMDAAQQFLAVGITPLLQQMTPLLQSGAAWLSQLQQTNPEVATLTSGLLATLAVAAPLAIVFNQMAEAAKTLKAAGVFGALGTAGKGIGLAAIGGLLGAGAARGAGTILGMGETDPEMKARYDRLANYTPEQFWNDARDLLVRAAFDLNSFVTKVLDGLTALAAGFAEHVAFMMRAMSQFVGAISDMLPKFAGKDAMQIRQAELRAASDHLIKFAAELRQANTAGSNARSAQVADLTTRLFPLDTIDPEEQARQIAAAENALSAERTKAITEYYKNVDAIEADANNQRVAQTEQYERQRTQTIRQYEQTIAREAEDFARARARAIAQHEKAIADVREAAMRREAKQAEDLARNIAEMRADSAERIGKMEEDLARNLAERRADSAERVAEMEADREERIAARRKDSADRVLEIEENYARERRRAAIAHQDAMLDAASRLDARAIFQEERRYMREQQNRAEAHQEQIDDESDRLQKAIDEINKSHDKRLASEKKSLDKQIRQAQDAHDRQVTDQKNALTKRINDAQAAYDRQLEDARAADEERIEDMQDAFDERIAREDEDREIRLGRLADDHNAQLAEMGRAHRDRMKQIDDQERERLEKLTDAHNARMVDLGVQLDAYEALEKEYQKNALERWQNHYKALEEAERFKGEGPVGDPTKDPEWIAANDERNSLMIQQNIVGRWSMEGIALQTRIDELDRIMKDIEDRYAGRSSSTEDVETASAGVETASESVVLASNAASAPPAMSTASAGGSGGNSLSIGDIFVNISGVPGQTAEELYALIDQRLYDTVRRAAGSYQ